MVQYRASWKRLMPWEWIREGQWVIPWMLHLCEGAKPRGKAELYAVPIGLPWNGLDEEWLCGSGLVLTWVLRLQTSALGTHGVCRTPAVPRSSPLPVPCHRCCSQGAPWAKRDWFKRQEDGGGSGALQNTCLWSIFNGIQWSLNLLTSFWQRPRGIHCAEERDMPHHCALGLCRGAEDGLSWGRGLINLDR